MIKQCFHSTYRCCQLLHALTTRCDVHHNQIVRREKPACPLRREQVVDPLVAILLRQSFRQI
jgi:hypothetical protein